MFDSFSSLIKHSGWNTAFHLLNHDYWCGLVLHCYTTSSWQSYGTVSATHVFEKIAEPSWSKHNSGVKEKGKWKYIGEIRKVYMELILKKDWPDLA